MASVPLDAALLWSLAEGTSGHLGPAFLESLVGTLRTAMDVTLALLTQGVENPRAVHARTLLAWRGGGPVENWEYVLDGTPCALVYGGERLIIPCGVKHRFPRDHKYEGYAGVPLHARDGSIGGHLAVFSAKPLREEEVIEKVLRLYGFRAEAELQRLAFDRERDRLLEELRTLNQRLLRRYGSVREANAHKTQVLGVVAHDLRAPLAAILSRAELIGAYVDAGPAKADQVRTSCMKIVEAAERMNRRIGAVLDSAREDSSTLSLSLAPCDIAAIVRTAVDVNEIAASRKAITVQIERDESLLVVCDETMILEAIDNLVSNAIKYSDPGTAVMVRLRDVDGGAEISVQDQGQGLDGADIEKAFRHFTRLSAQPTGGEDSVGLGLASVRMIADRHGGTVSAQSPGRGLGATFTLRLPRSGPVQ